MKTTKRRLKQIIREELNFLSEDGPVRPDVLDRFAPPVSDVGPTPSPEEGEAFSAAAKAKWKAGRDEESLEKEVVPKPPSYYVPVVGTGTPSTPEEEEESAAAERASESPWEQSIEDWYAWAPAGIGADQDEGSPWDAPGDDQRWTGPGGVGQFEPDYGRGGRVVDPMTSGDPRTFAQQDDDYLAGVKKAGREIEGEEIGAYAKKHGHGPLAGGDTPAMHPQALAGSQAQADIYTDPQRKSKLKKAKAEKKAAWAAMKAEAERLGLPSWKKLPRTGDFRKRAQRAFSTLKSLQKTPKRTRGRITTGGPDKRWKSTAARPETVTLPPKTSRKIPTGPLKEHSMKITKNMINRLVKEELRTVIQEKTDPVSMLTNLVASVETELKMIGKAIKQGDTKAAMSGVEMALGDIDDVKGALGLGSPEPPEPVNGAPSMATFPER